MTQHPRSIRIRLLMTTVAVAALGVATLPGQNLAPGAGNSHFVATVTPEVAALVLTEITAPGLQRLRVLSLWRGRPRWHGMVLGSASNGGGGGGGLTNAWARLGGRRFEIVVDNTTELVTISGRQFDLREANVFFFDDADTGGRLTGTLRVEAVLARSAGTAALAALAPVLAIDEVKEFVK